ncbi:MAG: pentapeptide repeat-containing protein [Thermoguttaceae bacterium]|nr:pentapeptide repeat-containing protein [Thermoguttaceae bacterium]
MIWLSLSGISSLYAQVMQSQESLPSIKGVNHEARLTVVPAMEHDTQTLSCNYNGRDLRLASWDAFIHLDRCTFRGANLKGAVMDCAGLESCDFTDATIDGASIYLTAEQLCSTSSYRCKNLRGFRSYAPLSGVSFAGFDLRDTMLYIDETCDLTDADIRGATIHYSSRDQDKIRPSLIPAMDFPCHMIKSTKSYKEGTLEGLMFSERVNWSGIDLSGLNLTNVNFSVISAEDRTQQWKDTQFHDSVITGADCRNLTLEQIKQTWNYKNGRMKGIIVSKAVKSALNAEKAAMDATKPADATAADAAADIPEIAE